jgi:5-methylcytosine-specific restriction enzyme subunit McrC
MSSARIPVRNLYYLLAYAWESFPESEESKLGLEVCPDLINLLAKLLCQQVQRLVRRGLEKRYLSQLETGVRISGRIALTETSRLKARHSPQVCFEIDELTSDILPNRILKSTLSQLRCSEQLASSLHDDVWRAFIGLPQVEEIRLTSAVFSQLLFHRNNRHYRLAIDICQLLHDLCLPDSSKRNEQRIRFLDILEDEACMERVFEKFVLNFARTHIPESRPGSQFLRWQGAWTEPDGQFLPRMQTDLTLQFPNRRVILDCKYYREALKSGQGKPKLHPGHLYQLMAYLQNSAAEGHGVPLEGVLLYPTNGFDLELDYKLLGFPIRIRTLDLSREWWVIDENLREILEARPRRS